MAEEEAMEQLVSEYENIVNSDTMQYNDNTLPTPPKLTEGMVKIKWNNVAKKWERVSDNITQWYNYANKEWANVVLVGEDGKDATGTVDVFNDDGTLNEDSAYTQLVWIPRYAYQITSQYHTEGTGAGNINIVFIDTNNKGKDGTEYSTEYPTAITGADTGMEDYVVHPAFDYGGEHLSGFWMGKYESSNTNCTTDVATGEVAYTGNEVMTVKANVTSWRQISIGDAFTTCLSMNESGNPYGLNSSDSVVDPHMVKNDEWGAVAYLSRSIYGKNAEVWNNSNSSYITGMAGSSVDVSSETETNAYNTELGVEASTTGNVTGVYDMSGGAWERAAAYITNGHENLTINGGDLTSSETANKYRNIYSSTVSDGAEAQASDYELAVPANGHYGDAIYETSSSYMGPNGWYRDNSLFPHSGRPFFVRGGGCTNTSPAGVFYYNNHAGEAYMDIGFRVAIDVF